MAEALGTLLGLLTVIVVVIVVVTMPLWRPREPAPPICSDTGAPKYPGNCWNVRCQLGGTCCRTAGGSASGHQDGSPADAEGMSGEGR